ncbi:ACT domain-containing protein [Syncephalis fuscata]|nr:ACT domain-containing protein [Syncephalis fuscata]
MSIYVLPARVQLLSLPPAQRACITHAVTKSVFFSKKRDTFFNYTENALEISIIAEVDTVTADFAQIACNYPVKLVIEADVFRVLEIDTDVGQGNASKRIIDVSAPLAKAGISIFYLSTYQTDYVLVKERRLRQVVAALEDKGFIFPDLDLSDVPLPSPTQLDFASPIPANLPASAIESEKPLVFERPQTPRRQQQVMADMRHRCPKTVPTNHLTMVGLNREHQDGWAMRVLELLFYPELLQQRRDRRFVSYTLTGDGISLVTNSEVLDNFDEYTLNRSLIPASLRVVQIHLASLGYDRYGIVYSMSEALNSHGINLLYLSTHGTANILVNEYDLDMTCEALGVQKEEETDELLLNGSGGG